MKRTHATLTIDVPCQFGDGLHPLTVGVDKDGGLLWVRSACDRLDPDIAEVARALTGSGYACCADVKRKVIKHVIAVPGEENRSIDFPSWEGLALLKHIVSEAAVHAREQREERKERRSPWDETSNLRAEVLKKYQATLDSHLRVHGTKIALRRLAGKQQLIVTGKWGDEIARYRGHGAWQISNGAVQAFTGLFRYADQCPMCGVRNTRAHQETKKHARAVLMRLTSALAALGVSRHAARRAERELSD